MKCEAAGPTVCQFYAPDDWRRLHDGTLPSHAERLERSGGGHGGGGHGHGGGGGGAPRLPNSALANVYELYWKSTFCLQPPGDDLSRKGIIDSLLLGCEPER